MIETCCTHSNVVNSGELNQISTRCWEIIAD